MSGDPSAEKETIEVQILGEPYTVRSETSPEYTRRVAKHIDETADEIRRESGIVDQKKLAILAAMAITDQFFRVREGLDRLHALVERRAERLASKVLEVVDREPET